MKARSRRIRGNDIVKIMAGSRLQLQGRGHGNLSTQLKVRFAGYLSA